MVPLRIESAAPPFDRRAAGRRVVDLIARAYYCGILKAPVDKRLTLKTVGDALRRLQAHGFVADLPAAMAALQSGDPKRVASTTDVILGAMEESPVPETEWRAMREVFDEPLLTRLLGISPASLRRYASRARKTPDDVADRLHFIALLVADLAGAYNPIGIRRWFERLRPQLGGLSPLAALGRDWRPADPRAREVRALARALTGSPGT